MRQPLTIFILFIFVLIVFTTKAQTKMKTKWMPYAGLSQNITIHEADQQIWNYSRTYYDQFPALPVEDYATYELNSKELPVPNRFQYMIEFGVYRWLNQTGRLHLGVNLYNFNVAYEDFSRLRFSDQIDSNSGFVSATGFSQGDIEFVYNNISFEATYFIEQNLKKMQSAHRFGLGLNINVVMRSQYFMYANPYYDYNSGSYVESLVAFYSAKDIGLKDRAMSFYPTFYYEIRAYQFDHLDLWLSASYSDGLVMMPSKKNAQQSRPSNIRNSFISLGMKFNFNRN
ncbi:MAG: hypothetical protein ACI8SE_000678 [Bacteroidia bacterium]|jgi:hypothetical protein